MALAFATACSRGEGNTPVPPATKAEAGVGSASGSASTMPLVPVVKPNAPLVEASNVSTCAVRHSCSLSHPGLGSSTRGTGVNLTTCTRTSWASSGGWRAAPGEDEPSEPKGSAQKAKDSGPASTPVASADCARLKRLVASVTPADLASAHEPAPRDTAFCQLYVECGSPPTKAFDVQRQTTTGQGHVVELVRAVYGQP